MIEGTVYYSYATYVFQMSTLSYIARQLRITPSHDPSLTVRDVAYLSGTDAHVNHKLDIFLPAPTPDSLEAIPVGVLREEDKRVPIVFHVHGGAWVYGGRGEEYCGAPSIARTCAQQGFVGVVASYRLAWISPTSFLAWSSIVGLIVLLVSLALRSWQLATGYAAFMTLAYVYNFFCRVRTPVNLEHVSSLSPTSGRRRHPGNLSLFRWSMICVWLSSTFAITFASIILVLIPIRSSCRVIQPAPI